MANYITISIISLEKLKKICLLFLDFNINNNNGLFSTI